MILDPAKTGIAALLSLFAQSKDIISWGVRSKLMAFANWLYKISDVSIDFAFSLFFNLDFLALSPLSTCSNVIVAVNFFWVFLV